MDHHFYKLEFRGSVHFGSGALDDTGKTFHADTLFSALCQEAVKYGVLEQLVSAVSEDALRLSDAFPIVGDGQLFLPKPIIRIEAQNQSVQGDSKQKKLLKKRSYLTWNSFDSFLNGTFRADEENPLESLGRSGMRTHAALRGHEDPEPFRVKAFRFADGNGLYLIAGTRDKSVQALLEQLLDMLSYSGIGGKRSAGFGRFDWKPLNGARSRAARDWIKSRIQTEGGAGMLLSAALPSDQELDSAMEDAAYQLSRRSGFVSSETYADVPLRKQDVYLFAAGSCFRHHFQGELLDVSCGGAHPVYRYAKAMFLRIDGTSDETEKPA